MLGDAEGNLLGLELGFVEGALLGLNEGLFEGDGLGLLDGALLGFKLGLPEGAFEGFLEGDFEGFLLGAPVGDLEGLLDGDLEGSPLGIDEGSGVNSAVGVGACVGGAVVGAGVLGAGDSMKGAKVLQKSHALTQACLIFPEQYLLRRVSTLAVFLSIHLQDCSCPLPFISKVKSGSSSQHDPQEMGQFS